MNDGDHFKSIASNLCKNIPKTSNDNLLLNLDRAIDNSIYLLSSTEVEVN